jgi:hypothetical protein
MRFVYHSGEEIKEGDRVLFHGEPGGDRVRRHRLGRSELDWYVKEFGGGVMVLEPKVFGRAFLTQTENAEDLVLVSRAPAAP